MKNYGFTRKEIDSRLTTEEKQDLYKAIAMACEEIRNENKRFHK